MFWRYLEQVLRKLILVLVFAALYFFPVNALYGRYCDEDVVRVYTTRGFYNRLVFVFKRALPAMYYDFKDSIVQRFE